MNCVAVHSLGNPIFPFPLCPLDETYSSSHPKNSQRQMGHSLSLGLDETYRIYYLHIYIRIYMRYNFAATAVAAQP